MRFRCDPLKIKLTVSVDEKCAAMCPLSWNIHSKSWPRFNSGSIRWRQAISGPDVVSKALFIESEVEIVHPPYLYLGLQVGHEVMSNAICEQSPSVGRSPHGSPWPMAPHGSRAPPPRPRHLHLRRQSRSAPHREHRVQIFSGQA